MFKDNSSARLDLNILSMIIISMLMIAFIFMNSSFMNINMDIAIPLYIISLISYVFIIAYLYKFGIPKTKINLIIIMYFVLLIYTLFISVINKDLSQVIYNHRKVVFISIFILFSYSIITKRKLTIFGFCFSILTLILFLDWIQVKELFLYQSYFGNPNTLGITMYLLTVIHFISFMSSSNLINRLYFSGVILVDLLLLYSSSSRASWIALIISLLFYFSWPIISRNKIFFNITFLLALLMSYLYSYIYPLLPTTEIGMKLDTFIIELTNKTLFSGREKLWLTVIEAIYHKPFLGYGTSVNLSDFMNTSHNSHNTFLTITLETGFIGLFIYSLLLYLIWNIMYIQVKSNQKKISHLKIFPSFFISITIYQTFEHGLIMGGYAQAALEWLIIGIGISMITRHNYLYNRVYNKEN